MRSDYVDGEAVYPPIVGNRFEMTGEPFDCAADGAVRWVSTSPVVSVDALGEFTTRTGSVYRIELIDPDTGEPHANC